MNRSELTRVGAPEVLEQAGEVFVAVLGCWILPINHSSGDRPERLVCKQLSAEHA